MPDSASPLVVPVVLNCNGEHDLPECLETLSRQTYKNIRVIVSDNASSDGSPEWAEREYPDVKVIKNGVNLGWSGANNVGIRQALDMGADYIWILNNDVHVDPACIERLVDTAGVSAAGTVASLIYYYDEPERLSPFGGYVDFDHYKTRDFPSPEAFDAHDNRTRFVSGCALFVSRDVFTAVGLIDERFFIYYEDVDFCLRAAQAGFQSVCSREAVLYHKISAYSGGAGAVSPFKTYQNLRSSLYFWRKYLGFVRFHRSYCAGNFGKYLNKIERAESPDDEIARATLDAVWNYLCPGTNAKRRQPAPSWFVSIFIRRPWLLDDLMALRIPGIRRKGTTDTHG